MAILIFNEHNIHDTIYTYNLIKWSNMKNCRLCDKNKPLDQFYHHRGTCNQCLKSTRINRHPLSICRQCKIEFRPGVKGGGKFCTDICRFNNKIIIDNNTNCWMWQSGKDRLGYGKSSYKNIRSIMAHRLSYILFREEIEPGKIILHSCHTTSCVNPEHLRQGSDADNTRDKLSAGHQNSPKGQDCHYSKINNEQALEIRSLASKGTSATDLAKIYGIKFQSIRNIIRRITWKHI